ncbi:hypothetical protein SESBI_08012 [Sesbania bispinosa]|nr:hypothetical protein SESBI_08012 [Sesbania bispinosa]
MENAETKDKSTQEVDLMQRSTKKIGQAESALMKEISSPIQEIGSVQQTKLDVIKAPSTEMENVGEEAANGIQSSPYGPWMLVKKIPRKTFQRKKELKPGSSTGSRFAILTNKEQIENPIQQDPNDSAPTENSNDQIVTRVRDPCAGKNPQSIKSSQGKKPVNSAKLPKQVDKQNQSGVSRKNPKDKEGQNSTSKKSPMIVGKDSTHLFPAGNLPERKDNTTPVTRPSQKEENHAYVLQLIKKWGSEEEMKRYGQAWAADN